MLTSFCTALDDAPPMCEISTVNRKGRLPELTKEDIRGERNFWATSLLT